MLYDRMALLLNLWYVFRHTFAIVGNVTICNRTALMLGILYLAFQAFPVIFEEGHGFDIQSTGMSFLGIGLGMVLAISTQPFWNRYVVHPYFPCTHLIRIVTQISDYSSARHRNMVARPLPKHVSSWVN